MNMHLDMNFDDMAFVYVLRTTQCLASFPGLLELVCFDVVIQTQPLTG